MLFDDILACMVANRNMVSVEPSEGTESFKSEVYQIWDDVKSTMEYAFEMISKHSGFGEMIYRVRDYEVMLYVLPDTETALVAIVPVLAHKGLLQVAMENARREIIQWMDKKDE